MHKVALKDAVAYAAPEHFGMCCLRLQGLEAGPSSDIWLGLLEIEPGGRVGRSASPSEKLYFVLEGAVEMTTPDEAVVLEFNDSCRIAPHESRWFSNTTETPAKLLIAMSLHSHPPHSPSQGPQP